MYCNYHACCIGLRTFECQDQIIFCYWVQIYKCNTKVVRYEVLTGVPRIKDSSLLRYYIVLIGKQLPKSWRNILLRSLA